MSFMKDFDHLKIQMKSIVTATNNFDPTSVIGCGGFGRVYRGELSLPNGPITVAFKKLDRRLGQGNTEFWREIMMLSRYKHENLISLMHYAIEGDEMILVHEYASRGSLDRYLTNATTLTWMQRLKICVGVARGLHFLHDPKSTQQRVLHRDIKSANILLDENWTAKVSDFGLSKLGPANQPHSYLISQVVGTPGYCDPLYLELGFLSKESDVYSFGVVLFEILCGRLCYEQRNHELTEILVPNWRRSYDENRLDEIILSDLKDQMDPGSMESFSAIAYHCVKKAHEERPTMAEIVKELELSLKLQMSFMKDFDHLKIQMKDIVTATNNFDPTSVIGCGGFGRVYRGEISFPNGPITLAFKKLDHRLGQGNTEFWKEIMMLSRYKHENLISLMHYAVEGDEMILVYEYASRGSLDRYLSNASTLTWTQRLKICVGVAQGLHFLHDPKSTQQRVLHRDIKSANILLDENWTAKVSDFGLSKLGPANQTHSYLISHTVGTPGYCDPLYWELGFLSKESDIYSFGVVLFEILCGRLCYEQRNHELTEILVPKWRRSYDENRLDEIILRCLKDQMDPGSLETFSAIAYRCVKKAREDRPILAEIVEKLEFSLIQQMSFMKDFDHLKIQMKDIVTATNNFDPTSVIGCGGFGRVYRGELSLPNGPITVAFKKLDRRLGQGNAEFWKEIMMLSRYKHENLISLMHYAIEGDEMILVYEYASRGSLDRYLTNARALAWTQRLKICVGVARGLHFLHDLKSTQQRVLHRDIKSANILLDENWTAKVSDFGLSKLGPANQAHSYLTSHAVGTPGYCDPLYWELGFLSKESDVYSFGVVLFEILCGRLCYEQRNHELTKILVPKWRRSYDEKRLDEIILPGLKVQMDPGSMETFSAIAYRCVKKAREDRPIVAEIVERLEFSLLQQKIFEDAHKNSSKDMASILFNGQADQSLDIGHQHNEADDDDNLPKDKESEYMQSSDSYSSKGKKKSGDKATQQDHYALLGLGHLRYLATEDQIRKSYHETALKHHSNKQAALLLAEETEDAKQAKKDEIENRFKAIQEAYEVLMDPTRRRIYDSTDEFDDEIPTDCSPQDFFKVFGPAFMRNGRWSVNQPIPSLGDDNTLLKEVDAFYDFWFSFKSWREFPHENEYDLEQAESRDHKRWMERQNAKLSEKARKEERARIRSLVDNAYKRDPRIIRRKETLKAEKQKKKEAKFMAKKQQEKENRLKKEEEDRQAAEAASNQKKIKEKEKKLSRKERTRLRTISTVIVSNKLLNISQDDVENICMSLDLLQLRNLCDNMEGKEGDNQSQAELLKEAISSGPVENSQQNGSVKVNGSVSRSSFEKKEKPWGKEEIELLRKGIVKYPKGTSRRWKVISEYIGTGRSVEEILKATKTVLLQKPDSAKAFDSFLEKRKPSVNISSVEEVVGASSTVTPTPTQPDVVPPKLSQDANKVDLVGSSSDQDVWSAVQETALVQALKTFPKETNARWDRVAAAVPGKSVVQCKKQFALVKEKFRNKKK
ncbi:hypothetical protein R6Q59_015494 [Mikania micrantha]